MESSITHLDAYLNKTVQVIAFGTSYVGKLLAVDFDKGILVLQTSTDPVTLDLARVESFEEIHFKN